MKYFLFFIGFIISLSGFGQQNLNARQLRLLNNTDSAGINSTTGIIRYDPITGKYRFYNALTGTWFTYDAGAGISNSAAANELMKSDGTNAVASGIFSTAAGDLDFGTGLAGAARTFNMTGTAADVGFNLFTKGDGNIIFDTPSTIAQIGFNASDVGTAITVQGKSGLTKAFVVEDESAGNIFEVQLDGDLVADALTYNATTDLFSVPNATISTVLNPSYLGTNRLTYKVASGLTDEAALQYDPSLNQILLSNTALTHTTSIFGGEIQLDFPGGSDDVTINNNQFAVTGLPEYTISANQDLTLSTISGDVRLAPGSDVELAPGGLVLLEGPGNPSTTAEVLGRNTVTGAIERRTDITGEPYTPTLTDETNISLSTLHNAMYSRSGSIVNLSFAVTFTVTDPTSAQAILGISLPVASNFTTSFDAIGNGDTNANPSEAGPGIVTSNSTDDRLRFEFFAINLGGSVTYYCTAQYEIK